MASSKQPQQQTQQQQVISPSLQSQQQQNESQSQYKPLPPVQQETDTFVYQQPSKQQYQSKIYIPNCDCYVPSQVLEQLRNDHLIQQNPNIIIGSRSAQAIALEKQETQRQNQRREKANQDRHTRREKRRAQLQSRQRKKREREKQMQREKQEQEKAELAAAEEGQSQSKKQLPAESQTKKAQPPPQQKSKKQVPIAETQKQLQQDSANNAKPSQQEQAPLEDVQDDQVPYIPTPFTIPGLDHLIDVHSILNISFLDIQSETLQHSLALGRYYCFLSGLFQCEGVRKKIICVSSFKSWGKRKSVTKDGDPSAPGVVTLTDLNRRGYLDFHVKILQDLCLALHTVNSMMRGSVIFSGLTYGCGEGVLFQNFKRALEQEKPLEIYGTGSNFIPMIHVSDLCQIIDKIAFSREFNKQRNWHFACDQSSLTQKELIQCISDSIGNGQVIEKPINQCFLDSNYDEMTLNIKVQGKQSIKGWSYFQGFKANSSSIISQFNLYRGLKPNKIVIIGAPASGKTTLAEHLKKSYGLPLIQIQTLIQDIQADESFFGKQIKQLLEQIRTQKVQEQRKLYEEMKKKKKGKGMEQFNPDKIVGRLPQTQLKRVLKWRLNQSDCQNKGYILDGVIKTYSLAEGVFCKPPPVETDIVVEDTLLQLQQNFLPNSVFFIQATDDQIKERIKGLTPEQQSLSTHWTQQHTIRRLQNYAKLNTQEGSKPVLQFFEHKSISPIKTIGFNDENVLDILTSFVERDGPLGFKKQSAEEPTQQNLQDGERDPNKQNESQQEEQQDEEASQEQHEGQFNLDNLTEKQQKILNEKSRPIRQYLIDNVIPQITEGLLEICKDTPEDPIDFLIDFLDRKNAKGIQQKRKKSNKVLNTNEDLYVADDKVVDDQQQNEAEQGQRQQQDGQQNQ